MEQTLEKGKLNKKTLENQLGRKLTLKEKLLLPVVKAKAKSGMGTASGRSQLVALLLCIFVGGLGIHRFYLGYTGLGILYLFTAGLFGIGWFIDLIRLIIPNGLTPKGQSSY
ncbi:MAG: TM2 domain-containing protein [Saprospiraceae bacterium]